MPGTKILAQEKKTESVDEAFIRQIHEAAVTQGLSYDWLHFLTKKIGARLSGSPQAMAAVEYTRQVLDTFGLDSVWLQPCMVPHWVRGEQEILRVMQPAIGAVDLSALAIGNSNGTGSEGVSAEVIEVKSLEEVEKLGRIAVQGKIVFFNRPFDETKMNTFAAYGGAVDQRTRGASIAAKYGAIAVVVRSMASGITDVIHTGALSYQEGAPKIPAVSISTKDAEWLSALIKQGGTKIYMRSTCEMLPDKLSYNVIGEIKGSQQPEEIIVVGGHLDSWDVCEGAHDDGAGCVQSMEVLYLLKKLNYKPKRTIRCVLFMNEENGLRGGVAYADEAKRKGETHLAAIESDRGGFTPRGFSIESNDEFSEKKFAGTQIWQPLLDPYRLGIRKGGGGADISPLRSQGTLLIGYEPDSQRYFDIHHSAADTFEKVNKRELELGSAAMAAFVYLLDKYGVNMN